MLDELSQAEVANLIITRGLKPRSSDEMIANLRAEIDILTEYKQRLIADAVTGQNK